MLKTKCIDVPFARVRALAWIIVVVCVEAHSILYVAWSVERIERFLHARWRVGVGGIDVQCEVLRRAADLRCFQMGER